VVADRIETGTYAMAIAMTAGDVELVGGRLDLMEAAAQSLRAAGVSTPAIALTALARREDADAAQAAGFQLHIAKPIDVAGLVDAVARLVHTVH